MAFIRTVRGDIEADAVGRAYIHEHLLAAPPPPYWTEDLALTDEQAAAAELRTFAAAGGALVVEMTTPDYNRDAAGLRRLSEATGVHLVAASGYNKEKFCIDFIRGVPAETLTDRFCREIERGMDGGDVRAGLVKASSMGGPFSRDTEQLFIAAARTHLRTGAPISTHTEAGAMALEQVALLRAHGAPPEHIIIGHLDRRLDLPFLEAVAATGVHLSFDQIGKTKYYPDEARAEALAHLIGRGYGARLVLGGDLARRAYWPSYGFPEGPGFGHILRRFSRLLLEAGCAPADIDRMLLDNPRRALSFAL